MTTTPHHPPRPAAALALLRALGFFMALARRARVGAALAAALMTVCALPARADVSLLERSALNNLYTYTNGASWNNKTGWSTGFGFGSGPICSGGVSPWFGVFCTADDAHVRAINLDQNNLTGGVPDLSDLKYLQYLSISSVNISSGAGSPNHIRGSLPDLSGLTALQQFFAIGNEFTGPIPALPASIQVFMVRDNALTGGIPNLSGLTSLSTFDVANNQLSGAIPSIGLPPASLAPNPFFGGGASLCSISGDTNALTLNNDPYFNNAWNTATGLPDWHKGCRPVIYNMTVASSGQTSWGTFVFLSSSDTTLFWKVIEGGTTCPAAGDASYENLGVAASLYTQTVTGLTPNTTYLRCAYAQNTSLPNGQPSAVFSSSFTTSAAPVTAPAFTTAATLPNATEGAAYSTTLAATGATGFAVAGGSALPSWLKLDAATGVLSGTPPAGAAASGPYHFTIVASNAGGADSRDFTLAVNPAPAPTAPPAFTTASTLPYATEGAAYSVSLSATGATSFAVAGGSALPSWLTLDAATGVLSGTPPAGAAAASPYKFTITATNANGSASRDFTLTVHASSSGTGTGPGGTTTGPGGGSGGPGAHDGIYHITNADGSPGDYLSIHTNGSDMIAAVYRSAGPANGASFALTDGGASVAALYRWGSFDLYEGSVSGNSATLTGYAQYGLCNASASITFSGAGGGTIKVTPTGLSGFAPPGASAADCSGAGQTLNMQEEVSPPSSAASDGVYLVQNADGSQGDYVSVHTASDGHVIATAYRSASASASAGFQVIDGGQSVATLYRWGSFDLYDGTQSGSTITVTGYAQYGLCKATGTITVNGDDGTIHIAPDGPSEFAPSGTQPTCSGAGQTLTMHREY